MSDSSCRARSRTLLIAFARPVRKSFGRVRRGLCSARSLQRFDEELIVHHRRAFELDAGLKVRNFLRSDEHTSELQSLMRISYAVFCLKKKNLLTRQIDTTLSKKNPTTQN